ncbi:hypothetical protein AB0L70_40550 [Kribbella sp. NPDC051952]
MDTEPRPARAGDPRHCKPGHLVENLTAGSIQLTPAEIETLTAITSTE